MVVNPHGGPMGIADVWGFDRDVQLMASRGYAVMRVNFRGSGNHGRQFERAGYRQWGGLMQDDLTDATRWAITQGIADPGRICIYGASYGGYAALMGAVKEPDLYRCAAGHVGVYDLNMMYGQGDIASSRMGRRFLVDILGREGLDAASPALQAERIRIPVLLTAGDDDERAPEQHTERMRDALQRLGKPVETKIYEGEGHGFTLLDNAIDFQKRLLDFLGRHLQPAPATP
jgi:dipeptidyl aminopeptidase/acylaminoacyl peptidase